MHVGAMRARSAAEGAERRESRRNARRRTAHEAERVMRRDLRQASLELEIECVFHVFLLVFNFLRILKYFLYF